MNRKKYLEVEFIGGEGSLTTSEENALSIFFKKKKLESIKELNKNNLRITKRKSVAS